MNCPSCQSAVPVGAVFCDNCGYDLRSAAQPVMPQMQAPPQPAGGGGVCSNCGHPNVGGAAFCENCGSPVSAAAPPPVQQYAQPPVQQYAPPPAQQYTPPVQQYAPPAGGTACPSCGAGNVAGASFCENCGAKLGGMPVAPPPPVSPPPAVQQPYVPPAGGPIGMPSYGAITGRLVVQGSNASVPIPQGKPEVIIGREDPVSGVFPEVNLDPFGGHDAGVSRQHAKLVLQGAQLMLVDMGGPNGTYVNKQKLAANMPHPVNNGDELRFGRLVLNYFSS